MSNVNSPNHLIVLPGGLPHGGKPRPSLTSPIHAETDSSSGPNYAGRMIALNPEGRHKRFQCGGFHLGPPKLLSAVVPPDAQMEPIHQAILAGLLIDITDHEEIKVGSSRLETVQESDTNKKIYFLTHPELGPVVFGTDDAALQAKIDAQIENGSSSIILPPGYDNPEKYLLKIKPEEKKPGLKERVKETLCSLIEKI